MLTALIAGLVLTAAPEPGKVTRVDLGAGVQLFATTPYGDAGMCGNAVAVVGPEGTLLFDSGGTPATAKRYLRQLRALRAPPVRYLVNSHWHWDHWAGNQEILAAFPAVTILTQEKTRRQMLDVEPRWNGRGLAEQLPGYVTFLAEEAKRDPAVRPRYLAARDFLEQKRSVRATLPGLTFADRLTLWLGDREVQVRHGVGITVGDTWLWLPRERVAVTGDLLLTPFPFAIGGTYPSQWLATLRELAALRPALVIPGHGPAERGTAALDRQIALFDTVLAEVKQRHAQGLSAEETLKQLSERAAEFAAVLELHEPALVVQFQGMFLETFVRRAHRELDGPLGELPDGL